MSAVEGSALRKWSLDGYYPVPSHLYKSGDTVDRELYFKYQQKYLVFAKANIVWSESDVQRIASFAVKELYIMATTDTEWHDFMDKKMSSLLSSEKISLEEKAKAIYVTSVSTLDSVFKNPASKEIAGRSITFVQHCIDYLNKDAQAFFNIFESSARNMSEHSHGLHVAAYAVTMAKQMGFKDHKDLLALGIGSLLHDIGKTKIPRSILDKPGKLDTQEMETVRQHVPHGVKILQSYGNDIPELSIKIVAQHHERVDGSGYPGALKGEAIHPFSRIVGLCDVFDTMTSHKPYKDQTSSVESVMEMIRNPNEFQKDYIAAFVKMMKR